MGRQTLLGRQPQSCAVGIEQMDADGLAAGDFDDPGQGLLEDIVQVDSLTGQQGQVEKRGQFFGTYGHALLQRLHHVLDLGFGPLPFDDFLLQQCNGIA